MKLQIECKFKQGLPSDVFYQEDSFQFISLLQPWDMDKWN